MVEQRFGAFAVGGAAALAGAVIGAFVAWVCGGDPLHGVALGGMSLGAAGGLLGWLTL